MTLVRPQVRTEVSITSPRWGHDDTWVFVLDESGWEILIGTHRARVDVDSNTFECTNETLSQWAGNDQVSIPSETAEVLVFAWMEYCQNTVDEDGIKTAIGELAQWINATTNARLQLKSLVIRGYGG